MSANSSGFKSGTSKVRNDSFCDSKSASFATSSSFARSRSRRVCPASDLANCDGEVSVGAFSARKLATRFAHLCSASFDAAITLPLTVPSDTAMRSTPLANQMKST